VELAGCGGLRAVLRDHLLGGLGDLGRVLMARYCTKCYNLIVMKEHTCQPEKGRPKHDVDGGFGRPTRSALGLSWDLHSHGWVFSYYKGGPR
jgi:hypothetical protein